MTTQPQIRTKTGAASFYIVAFATLLLTVIVMSFAALVISEVARTSSTDLSGSAYDSALAGIEDAKAAILNYRSCANKGETAQMPTDLNAPAQNCKEIIWHMENAKNNCDAVAHILGRTVAVDDLGNPIGVVIDETTSGSGHLQSSNNMLQAYSCIKIDNITEDYRSTLTTTNYSRVIHPMFEGATGATNIAQKLAKIRISWFSDDNNTDLSFTNFNSGSGSAIFPSLNDTTISISILQTTSTFNISQLSVSSGSTTDRGTLFLTPTNDASKSNSLSKDYFVKSNDKTAANSAIPVYCKNNLHQEFACSVTIALPDPVGGNTNSNPRSPDTLLFAVSIPYTQPDTDFSLEFYDQAGNKLNLKDTQIGVDSTGRANSFFRRIETRLETSDVYFPYPLYALQLTGNGDTLTKMLDVSSEYNF